MRIHHVASAFFCTAIVTCVQAATSITIDQRAMSFSQSTASLAKGDRMVFTNTDDITHNVMIFMGAGGDEKNLGLQKPGVPLSFVFDKSGRFTVRCNIHPGMKMAVTVK